MTVAFTEPCDATRPTLIIHYFMYRLKEQLINCYGQPSLEVKMDVILTTDYWQLKVKMAVYSWKL